MPPIEIPIQGLPRACHEALILAALAGQARHGYQIALDVETRSAGACRFKHGTLYPLLHQLEEDGHIAGTWSDEGPRGKRKAYRLTPAGRDHAAQQRAALEVLFGRLFAALDDPPGQGPGAGKEPE
jgi:PadR family transcriptional regulator PadR